MKQKYLYYFFLLYLFSCDNSKIENNIINHIQTTSISKIKKNTDVKALAKKANDYFKRDEYLKAKLTYDTLLTIDSSKGGYYFKRAYSKTMLPGAMREAINDYLRAIKLNYSEKKVAYLNIGVLYRGGGKYDSAIHYYNECLKIDSNEEKAQQEKREVIELFDKSK